MEVKSDICKKKYFKIVLYLKTLPMFRALNVAEKLTAGVLFIMVSIELVIRKGSGQNINSPKPLLGAK